MFPCSVLFTADGKFGKIEQYRVWLNNRKGGVMKEKEIYPLQSNSFHIQMLDFPEAAFYYEWQGENVICVFPGNGEDLIWSIEKKKLFIAKHIDNCQWLEEMGTHLLGIHVEAAVPVIYEETDLEKLFANLMQYNSFELRYNYVMKELPTVFTRRKMHPILYQAVIEIQKSQGQLVVEDLKAKINYNYSIRQLERIFKEMYGYGPKYFCRKERLLYMVEFLLKNSGRDIVSGIEHAGYSDRAHYQREFKKFMGMTPGEFLDKSVTVRRFG